MIKSFSGKNGFLSNFYASVIEMDGMLYPSVEHAYQAAKTKNLDERITIQQANGASEAKRLGRKVSLRYDWNNIRYSIMLELVRKKFKSDNSLRHRLKNTGSSKLIEGNNWRDTYWGVYKGTGKNYLGRILMQVRVEIREEEISND